MFDCCVSPIVARGEVVLLGKAYAYSYDDAANRYVLTRGSGSRRETLVATRWGQGYRIENGGNAGFRTLCVDGNGRLVVAR